MLHAFKIKHMIAIQKFLWKYNKYDILNVARHKQ